MYYAIALRYIAGSTHAWTHAKKKKTKKTNSREADAIASRITTSVEEKGALAK